MRLGLLLVVFAFAAVAAPKKSAGKPLTKEEPESPLLPVGLPIADAKKALEELTTKSEWQLIIDNIQRLLPRDDLTRTDKAELYFAMASAMSIRSQTAEARAALVDLVHLAPDFVPHKGHEKVLDLFRAVRAAYQQNEKIKWEDERRRKIASVHVTTEIPKQLPGGLAAVLSARISDPQRFVSDSDFNWRRLGESAWSRVPLKRTDEPDRWGCTLPGEVLASATGFEFEWFVSTSDREGVLATFGTAEHPERMSVGAGEVPKVPFKPVSRGVFIASAATTGVLGLGALVAGGLTLNLQQRYFELVQQSSSNGAVVGQFKRDGALGANLTTGLLIGAGVVAALTVALLPLTSFD